MVKTCLIPYGSGHLELHLEEENLAAELLPRHQAAAVTDEQALVRQALEHPIGSKRLCELAQGKKNIVLVTSDHTRAMPSRITLPLLLEELRRGSPEAHITILIATGLHRPTTEQEQRRMFGDEIVDREDIQINHAFCPEEFVRLCTLPSGAGFEVNKLAAECDLLVSEGFIEPHFFAGFSGGRKSILPGICSAVTVNENHSYRAISDRNAAAGVLRHNPVHEDMVFAARRVGLAFILNVALDGDKRIAAAFAGDMEAAHEQGVAYVRRQSETAQVQGDIAITGNGGLPLDQNLYQTPKAIATAEACVRPGGVIIMCASCVDGFGGEHFERLLTMGTPPEIDARLAAIAPRDTIPEQWCAQIFSRILQRNTVILVTDGLTPEQVRRANMIPAATPDEALALARCQVGEQARVVVIPDGVSVMVKR